MATDLGTRAVPEGPPSPDSRLARRPTLPDVVRGFGVTYGPSVVLDLYIVASFWAVLRRLLGTPLKGRAMRAFQPFALLGVVLTAVYVLVGLPRLRRWGATADEQSRELPGDEFVPVPAIESTWAVTVNAPAAEVWPWLAQIGQDRGGFYSYVWLENLAGCELHNADRVHPEWQHREVGETVRLHPVAGLPLAVFDPGRALVLEGWGAFVLEPVDAQTTRLISRSRLPHGLAAVSYALLLEIPHFVMQRRMLLGIKERAEQAQTRHGRSHQ